MGEGEFKSLTTRRFAQQIEKLVNGELIASEKK
jgi:hypothetical protein